ncbi:MAG: mycothiol conjugate amidase Mca [Acidimicrobiales bacterium]
MSETPCILTVHAHPDDESSKGAGTIAKYHAAGVRTVLVCCTGGEEGEILNPAMDVEEVKSRIGEVRRGELEAACSVIGYDEIVMLGYRDSGMDGSESNANPECFAAAPLEEAVEKLTAVVRRVRPDVIVTYPEDQSGYPHPDHLKVHEVSVRAYEAAGDPSRFPAAGEPFSPSKLYYTVWPVRRMREVHAKFLELGLESPFDERWLARLVKEETTTTSVDITGFTDVRSKALLAHATQVDPNSPFWFGLPPEVEATIHPYDEYYLARSEVGDVSEDGDLFAGVKR